MFYIRPARQKRKLIYDIFYQNMPKVFFVYKMEHHNLWNEYKNDSFQL